MPEFTVGQIVRVIRQPPNQWVQLHGEVGWIEEIQGEGMAYVQTLKLDGSCGGAGSIPFFCLIVDHGPQWKVAKAREDAKREKHFQECMAYNERFQTHIRQVAEKHGVTPEVARAIYEGIREVTRN